MCVCVCVCVSVCVSLWCVCEKEREVSGNVIIATTNINTTGPKEVQISIITIIAWDQLGLLRNAQETYAGLPISFDLLILRSMKKILLALWE